MLRGELPQKLCIKKWHCAAESAQVPATSTGRDQWLAAISAEQLRASQNTESTRFICPLRFVQSDYVEFAGVKKGVTYHLVQRRFVHNIFYLSDNYKNGMWKYCKMLDNKIVCPLRHRTWVRCL
uniref:Uncharacterized protein n=1 Tax=Ixodes ricinus TaxID=34613 RepID=A0A6B0UPJ3_IXORI